MAVKKRIYLYLSTFTPNWGSWGTIVIINITDYKGTVDININLKEHTNSNNKPIGWKRNIYWLEGTKEDKLDY